jgi:hypothetical protein
MLLLSAYLRHRVCPLICRTWLIRIIEASWCSTEDITHLLQKFCVKNSVREHTMWVELIVDVE